ncbi:MAG: hypothetical protein ACKVLH_10025 [Bacteroidia bacterium]
MKSNKNSIKLGHLTDYPLVSGALESGDNLYFGELYDRYSDKVYGKSMLMVNPFEVLDSEV